MSRKHCISSFYSSSHYIEVAQGGVFTIDYEYLTYFEPKKKRIKENPIFFYKRDIMKLFSAEATMFLKNVQTFFLPMKTLKKTSTKLFIIGPIFFPGPKPDQITFSVP